MSFIQSIQIQHVRHLQNLNIELDDESKKHLILTGRNGSGKTSVLLAMQRSIQSAVVEPPLVHPLYIESHPKLETPPLQLSIDNVQQASTLFNEGQFIVVYFPAKRQSKVFEVSGPKKLELQSTYTTAQNANELFLQYIVNLKTEGSFARDDGDMKTVERIDHWFNQFEQLLRRLFSDPELKLIFDRKNYNFYFQHQGHEHFDFNTLSDGYAAIMDIVTELMMRMKGREISVYDAPGIVMIDEVETHLHLDLQKKILPFLTSFFPNIQFIVTTHSPFVLNSISDAVIYDLEYQERITDLSGYSYEALVESYFEQDQYSAVLKEKVDEYASLIHNGEAALVESSRLMQLQFELSHAVNTPMTDELRMRFYELETERGVKHGSH